MVRGGVPRKEMAEEITMTDGITFGIVFRERETCELVKRVRVLTRDRVARILNIDAGRITDFVE